jgi:hypothetical protein
VPAGQSRATFKITGSSGDCDIYVRYGAAPTTSTWDYRPYTTSSNETVTVSNPTAGTWYVMLRAYAAYSGVTLVCSYTTSTTGLPDLTVNMGSANPYIETKTFSSSHCAVLEGSVVAGTRKLLRFTTETRNQGASDIVVGSPTSNPNLFTYDSCHGHYHYKGFLTYSLLNGSGQLIAGGAKIAFCIEDYQKFSSSAGPAKFDCNHQGLTVGWADTYVATLDGQWIDITNVPPGNYFLKFVVDPDNRFAESNEGNNSGQIAVTIPGSGGGGSATTLQSGVPVSSLSGSQGSLKYYKITVPSGRTSLTITTSGGSGDVDLYVKRGSQPSTSDWTYRSWTTSTSETVTVNSPTSGDWYITLHGYASYSGVTLRATY